MMMRPRNVKEMVVLILALTVSVCVIALVGAATYAVIANTIDWTTDHVRGPNITSPLATLIGSLLSAVIAGVVGYVSGVRSSRWEQKTGAPQSDPVEKIGSSVNEVLDKITRKG